MAKVMLVWELGAGLGHMAPMSVLAEALINRGHRVIVMLRDLTSSYSLFAGKTVQLLQAPFKQGNTFAPIGPVATYSDLLYNIGFGDAGELAALTDAWRFMIKSVGPDMVIADHSPTALLASRGLPVKRVLVGTGFCIPPRTFPMPTLQAKLIEPAEILRREKRVLDNSNAVLRARGQPVMSQLCDLYEAELCILETLAELDHFGSRAGAVYAGALGVGRHRMPRWPQSRLDASPSANGPKKRIFGYLKPFPALGALLDRLLALGHCTVLYVPGLAENIRQKFAGTCVQFEPTPVDMLAAAQECDLAILNGTSSTTIQMLLAGKPMLHIPFFLEQAITARIVERLGVGLGAALDRGEDIAAALDRLLADDRFRQSAEVIAARYRGLNQKDTVTKHVDAIERLLSSRV